MNFIILCVILNKVLLVFIYGTLISRNASEIIISNFTVGSIVAYEINFFSKLLQKSLYYR